MWIDETKYNPYLIMIWVFNIPFDFIHRLFADKMK